MKSFISLSILSLFVFSCASDHHGHNHGNDHDHSNYKPKFSKLGKGEKTPFSPGHEMIIHVSSKDMPSELNLTEVILAPQSLGAPPHIHKDEDEIFVVLEGTVHFLNGDKEVIAKTGTVASLPRGHYHGFWNPTNKPARMALVIAPGHFEKFFYAVEKVVREIKPRSPEEFGKIVSDLAAQKNVTIDMRKLPKSGLKLLPSPKKK